MAWSAATVPAADLALFDAGVPCILAAHAIRDGVPSKAIWTETGDTTDTDHTDDAGPTLRAYDGFAHPGLHTYPDSSETLWYLAIQLATPQAFDSIVINGSNLALASNVALQIADSADFATNLDTVLSTNSPTERIASFSLRSGGSGDQRLSNVEFLRLRVSHSTGFVPRVRELWIGQRVQLPTEPLRPYGDLREATRISTLVSKSGVRTSGRVEQGGAVRDNAYTIDGATDLASFEDWWDDCLDGSEPFYLVEDTDGTPSPYLMRLDGSPTFNPINRGNSVRELALSMREQNPFLELE